MQPLVLFISEKIAMSSGKWRYPLIDFSKPLIFASNFGKE